MLSPAVLPSPVAELPDPGPVLASAGVALRLKRDDLIHATVPGNKWRKLTPNLRAAADLGHTRLLTFGGAWSHHIAAVAAAAAATGFACTGVIRGDELARAPRNPVLAAAEAAGMELVFADRATYRATLRALDKPETRARLEERFGRCYVLPEGGSNALAARGAAEIPRELPGLGPRDVVCVPVGTGGTLAGIAAGLPPGATALGVAVLRGGEGYLEGEVTRLQRAAFGRAFANWRVAHTHHGGGYGRVPPELAAFTEEFERRHDLPIERRYVAKALHCLSDLAAAGAFPRGTRLTAVITGPPDAT
ncbi:1-aminocyclopropane-1-carboxylate deaminase/D-cysteine desulfhydrase [Streptomyces sp. PT12]|uniref:1-aminocyclopropane-1-carboxylate deaminase/D-cysteine desulfhydrase n=1 Tax=Streptomyces sp. PT12 TaxID=1510197 RepID=UPI000DE32F23|nr:pyridoxal-phosphate dependent enzyme [Streptomyces sp. PT12]RBM09010.1 1-aminocyclopropane-1-carboxylate deaminase [Streptomyces sp. PT12]